MTWYESEILIKATPPALEAVRSHGLLKNHAYYVENVADHVWHTPKVVHGLPEEGLLVIRPLAAPGDHAAEWFDQPILPWTELPAIRNPRWKLTPEVVRGLIPESEDTDFPPQKVLELLYELRTKAESPIVYYSCFMWGGDVELESAWILGSTERVLRTIPHREELAFQEFRSPTEHQKVNGDLLQSALLHLGLEIPTPYFALHTRGFDWDKQRL